METNAQQESEKLRVDINLKNLGTPNKNKVIIATPKGDLILIFSYETIVFFSVNAGNQADEQTIINLWSNTTGKLLNECCPNKSERLDKETFKEALAKAFNLVF